jgi:hypothetical protein
MAQSTSSRRQQALRETHAWLAAANEEDEHAKAEKQRILTKKRLVWAEKQRQKRGVQLVAAVARRDEFLATELLEQGAALETRRNARTPLLWAASLGSRFLVNALLDAGADVNATDDERGESVLFCAARDNHVRLVDDLLKSEYDPPLDMTRATLRGETPLMVAQRRGLSHVQTLLLEGMNRAGRSFAQLMRARRKARVSKDWTDSPLFDLNVVLKLIVPFVTYAPSAKLLQLPFVEAPRNMPSAAERAAAERAAAERAAAERAAAAERDAWMEIEPLAELQRRTRCYRARRCSRARRMDD